jgi:catechol 2,3-dioxygenase-like lactoylglutathione lyase family enzyme
MGDSREDHSMERFIAGLVKDFETGKIDRREFCQTVALAAMVYGAGEAANAQNAGRGLKVLGINHVSYTCPDYAKARDWYNRVLGMTITPGMDNGMRANLMFGPEPGKGGSFIVARTGDPTKKGNSQAVIDHICYTIPNWDDAKVVASFKERGLDAKGREGSRTVLDPFNNRVQIASAVGENAFKRG